VRLAELAVISPAVNLRAPDQSAMAPQGSKTLRRHCQFQSGASSDLLLPRPSRRCRWRASGSRPRWVRRCSRAVWPRLA